MSASWAKPGVKCVCVKWDADAQWTAEQFGIVPLALNQTYTVRQCVDRPGGLGLLLEGITNAENPLFDFEMAYDAARFRPLLNTSQEDDVRLIKSLLLEAAGLVPAGVELDA